MSNRYQIVVQGEASETDSDDEVYITSMSAPQPATSGAKVRQCVLRVPERVVMITSVCAPSLSC